MNWKFQFENSISKQKAIQKAILNNLHIFVTYSLLSNANTFLGFWIYLKVICDDTKWRKTSLFPVSSNEIWCVIFRGSVEIFWYVVEVHYGGRLLRTTSWKLYGCANDLNHWFQIFSRCSSYVGRTGRKQDINLARGCWYTGIVAHEIGRWSISLVLNSSCSKMEYGWSLSGQLSCNTN